MSDIDEKKIEEVLTRLLEGPVGDALCAKIVAQMGEAMPKAMEPYLTKAEYVQEGEDAKAKFAEEMKDSSEHMEGFFENFAGFGIRLHNLEAVQAVRHYSSTNPKEGLALEMVLQGRVRTRVLKDLDAWVENSAIDETPKRLMHRLISLLRPEKDKLN